MTTATGVAVVVADGHLSNEAPVRRQRSMKFSLYPSRPRTATAPSTTTTSTTASTSTSTHTTSEAPSTAPSSPTFARSPQVTALSIPSRSDSLLNRRSRQPGIGNAVPSQEPVRSFTSPPQLPPQLPPSLNQRPSEASRLRALNQGYRSHSSDGRQTPEPVLENFSRPRQNSMRRRNESPIPLHSASSFPLQAHNEDYPTSSESWTRDRGLSTSSSQSTNTFAPSAGAAMLRPSTSIPDFHTADSIYSRQRSLNSSGYRPGRGMARPDSNYSAHRREPIAKPTDFDGEEVRASFRSALTTTSSFFGNSGTERSSVMTKSSSATSVFEGKDEGMSVDDFFSMYEDGFKDEKHGERPTTADSEQLRIQRLCEAMNDSLMVPGKGITVRDSAAMFRNSAIDKVLHDTQGMDITPGSMSMEDTPGERYGYDSNGQNAYFDQRPTTSSRPITRAAPKEFDSTRDRYGFRRKNQHVPLEKFEAWNVQYTEHLARRRKKWVALMKENGLMTDRPNRFPPRSAKVKRFVRKGIPPDWRGDAWFYYAGGPAMVSKHYGVYDDMLRQAAEGKVSETDDEIIERDLNRTFPDNILFKPDPNDSGIEEPETEILQSLRRVLQAFSIYNPQIGYCQSLNFLAGLLLLFMNEEKSFWMLNIITRIYLPGTHELNLEGANVDLGVLMMSVKETMPSIWAKIGGELDGTTFDPAKSMRLPPITLCTTAWFMSCFIGTLPIETTLRVWDSFFYEGSKTLFRIALTIFKLGEQEIKAVTDPMEIFQVVQTIPRRLVDANLVLDSCFRKRGGFVGLSQEKIETRRAERRKGYADERERAANGNDVPVVVKRKATGFGRRKARDAVIS